MIWIVLILGIVILGALLYWQLILAEGAYLGRFVVTLLYDWSARLYDRIKSFDPGYEQWFLGRPLSMALGVLPDPLILDVATGTARLARTLFQQAGFHGRLIGLDYSRKMLQEAVKETRPWAEQLTFIWQDASQLPFEDNTFDAVTCLEALEFMPDPEHVLREMARVLRPGGIMLITNRIGSGARWMPGRTYTPDTFQSKLRDLPLEMIRVQPWQEDYDLLWGRKPGMDGPVGLRRLEEILLCPKCQAHVSHKGQIFICQNGHQILIAEDGVLESARISTTRDL
ncbi:MAG: class I SAM-dependent methyltransferase [Anaerolineae bacterium]|nr:class I SAM-dependent methyltransferase [Anaerolineae bacterium]